jgi:hypothetical protein
MKDNTREETNTSETTNQNRTNENSVTNDYSNSSYKVKSWTTYTWEFFMLFLAVFCGFLAEYQLENQLDSDREKKFISSLVNDLLLDSQDAAKFLKRNQEKVEIYDTILKLYNKDFSKKENSKRLYIYFLKSTGLPMFDPHTATLTQLKSSGSLGLIQKQNVIDRILRYDQQTSFLQKINGVYSEGYYNTWTAACPILHVNLYLDSAFADYSSKDILTKDLPPIKSSQQQLDVFFGAITRQQISTQQQVKLLRQQISLADDLLKMIKNEYDLN